MINSPKRRVRAARGLRHFLAAALIAAGTLGAGVAHAASESAQRIAEHFSQVRTMKGEFVQFGPRGEQTAGTFYIERPGKLRFDYGGAAKFRVTSDGTTVVLENRKLHTAQIYPLSKTPLKLLLDERINLSDGKVQSVEENDGVTTIKLADNQVFGNSTITMMFDSETYELRQWTVTDAQNRDTTVMIYNVETGVAFDPSVFHIDYRRVNAMQQNN